MPKGQTPGARLNYLCAGRGPAVLWLQGVGAVAEVWRPQIAALEDRFTCVAPDNRGIGGSEILDGRLSVAAMANTNRP